MNCAVNKSLSNIPDISRTRFLLVPAFFSCLLILVPYSVFGFWVDGTPELIRRSQLLVPLEKHASPLLAPSGEIPELGEQRKFSAISFSGTPKPYFVDALCRAIGQFCYIYVENEEWKNGNVSQDGVMQIKRAFEESIPANPNKGIYETLSESLGTPPDEIDQDPRIYILILDIPDDYRITGNFIGGYFDPLNQTRGGFRDPVTGLKFYSNEVEMIYIDSKPLKAGSESSKMILAHELQHMIHWCYDPDESAWVNEGCSEYASLFLCGYGGRSSVHVKAFEGSPQTSLVYWPNSASISLANYGAAYLWMMYLYENYGGVSIIKALINNPLNSISGVNGALLSMGYSERFEDVFSYWKVANLLDNTEFHSGKYGYKNLDVKVGLSKSYSYFPSSGNFQLSSWAANYIEFTGGNGVSNLEIEFKLRNPVFNFDVKIVTAKNGRPINIDSVKIQDGKGFISIPRFGDDVDTLILMPNWLTKIDADLGEILSYSFSANLVDDIDFRVFVLPNAIHQRYLDFIVKVIPNSDLDERESFYQTAYIPEISIKRSGKSLLEKQKMSYVSLGNKKNEITYVYQFYVPYGWDGKEIQWSIWYSGKSLDNGDLSKFLWVKKGKG